MDSIQIGAVAVAFTQLIRETFPAYPSNLYKATCIALAVVAAILSTEAWTLPALSQRAGMGVLAGLSATLLYSSAQSIASTKMDVTNPAATDPENSASHQ